MITQYDRQWCRLCAGRVIPKFALTPTPPANNYAEKPDAEAKRYTLELAECSRCRHVQQRFVLGGLFEDYKYTTPQTVATYLAPVAKLLRERFPHAKQVLEIGSNNGVFLDCLADAGFNAFGIDPASSHKRGIKEYFTAQTARNFQMQFDLIVANNVFAHIDNMQDVFSGIDTLLAVRGALVFEVQYWPALVAAGAFDMLYHEHMSYHAIAPIAKFLRSRGLVMTAVDMIPQHGGSIRVTAERDGLEADFEEPSTDWPAFTARVAEMRERVRAATEGRKFVLLGAAAKVTTLIHHCDIADRILFACDDTPQKQGRYIPGTGILIKPTSEINGYPVLLGAWNWERELRAKFPGVEMVNPFVVTEAECVSA